MKLIDILRPLFEREETDDVEEFGLDQIVPAFNVDFLDLEFTVTYEEEQLFKKHGIDLKNIMYQFDKSGVMTHAVPVLYPYLVNQTGNDNLLHAIKMRHPMYRLKSGAMEEMIELGVKALLNPTTTIRNEAGSDYMRHVTVKKRAGNMVRRALGQKNKPILVPAPSSSALTSMFADKIAEATGCKIVKALDKWAFPEMSSQIKTKGKGYTSAVNQTESPADVYRRLTGELQKARAEFERLDREDNDATMERRVQLDDHIVSVEQQIEAARQKGWAKKSMQSAVGNSRRMYDYVRANDQAAQLHNADIIIIDDNTVTSETIAECIKSLIRQGIVPSKVVAGICLHKYYSKKPKQEPN